MMSLKMGTIEKIRNTTVVVKVAQEYALMNLFQLLESRVGTYGMWNCGKSYFVSFVKGQAEQQDKIGTHTWPPVVYTLYFEISHVIFLCSMLSLFCAYAASDSSPCVG